MLSRRKLWWTLLGSGLLSSLQAQAPERTLASVFEAAVAWGKTAVGYKKRQWTKGRDELRTNLVGSTVSFTAQVVSRDVAQSGEAANYEAALPIGPSYTSDLAAWNLQELAPIWTEAKLMGTVAFRFTTIAYLVVQLTDDSGRLATTLTGTTTIQGRGKITDVSVGDSQVTISINVTDWQET